MRHLIKFPHRQIVVILVNLLVSRNWVNCASTKNDCIYVNEKNNNRGIWVVKQKTPKPSVNMLEQKNIYSVHNFFWDKNYSMLKWIYMLQLYFGYVCIILVSWESKSYDNYGKWLHTICFAMSWNIHVKLNTYMYVCSYTLYEFCSWMDFFMLASHMHECI